MYTIDILLLVIKGEGESGLQGRTLLQKKVYFLSELREVDLDFSPYHYGPYSSLVAGHLNSLVSHGFLEEKIESFAEGSTDPRASGEMRRHTYTLTREGNEVWDDIEKEADFEKWKNALDLINGQPISNDFNKLSIAAKVHYIVDWRGKSTIGEVRQVAEEYGWEVDQEDIGNVLDFLTDLGLVTPDKSNEGCCNHGRRTPEKI